MTNLLTGMKFQEILRIEGTNTYQVLTYFYGSSKDVDSFFLEIVELFNSSNIKVKQLHEDNWPIGVILVEAIFPDPGQAISAIVELSLSAINVSGIIGSICMFDGVFSGYEEVFSDSNEEQIYSVWVRPFDLNLAMDDALRASDEWKSVIGGFKMRLG